MKKYSMKIRDWEIYLEVYIKNREIEVDETLFCRDVVVKRQNVPEEVMELFQAFTEDVLDLDWDPDYGYQGGVG